MMWGWVGLDGRPWVGGCSPFIDEPMSSGDPQRATIKALAPTESSIERKRKRAGTVTQCQSKQEEKDGHHKTAIWTQWTYELKNYLRSRISQPCYSTGCRSNTSGAITVRSKPH